MHEDNDGNEKADALTRQGAASLNLNKSECSI